MDRPRDRVLILDFGSQYTQLIARRVRGLKVYCEIFPHRMTRAEVERFDPSAIILSGGPASVYAPGAPDIDPAILDMERPILGICYGMQLLAHRLGGRVAQARSHEYGRALARKATGVGGLGALLFAAFSPDEAFEVWMSHGDVLEALPTDFESLAATGTTPFAAMAHKTKPIFGLQFHPEVAHTPRGLALLEAFLFDIAHLAPTWTMASFLDRSVQEIRSRVGREARVICALSGGVDSSVVAALLIRAIPEQVTCIFVDHGLCRRGEVERVRELFEANLHARLLVVDASARFLGALDGVADPEKKRKIIGGQFIAVFEEEARRVGDARYLAQGTLYPDVIESVSAKGPSATIKSHHNVGGLPANMKLELIEPLRELFKDDVRLLGTELGLPRSLTERQPFPGPGLAVRVIGPLSASRIATVRHADAIVEEEVRAAGLETSIWQSFAVLLPVQSVGVMGDERTYADAIAVRAVNSVDGMTADWTRLPYDLLGRVSNRIINEVRGVNRVVYDISSKPPATIEWE